MDLLRIALRTRKTMVEVYGAELSGRRLTTLYQSARVPQLRPRHRPEPGDNISFNTVDYRRRLFT